MTTTNKQKRGNCRLVKAPQAPRRNKSAYMFFSTVKHKELRRIEEYKKAPTTYISKLVSKAWKALNKNDRQVYLDLSAKDYQRYQAEKERYKGPWKVPAFKHSAPVQPPSDFILYMKAVRTTLRKENPDISGDDLTRLIAKMWNAAPASIRRPFQDHAARLRIQYRRDQAAYTASKCAKLDAVASENSQHARLLTQNTVESQDSSNFDQSYCNLNAGAILSLTSEVNYVSTDDDPLPLSGNTNCQFDYLFNTNEMLPQLDDRLLDMTFTTPDKELAAIQQAAEYIPNMSNCSPIDDSFTW